MADDVDLMLEREAIFLHQQLQHRKPEGPRPTGKCLSCDEPMTEPARRWCDAECRDMFELSFLSTR